MTESHLVPLPGTDWQIWRDAVLRTTGFPADGLERFTAPQCAAVTDAYLAGEVGSDEFTAAFDAAVAAGSADAYEIASQPLFVEAVTWQNRNALHAVRGLANTGRTAARNQKRRHREVVAVRYWQRYCAKNDTVGFFGPVTWVRIDPSAERSSVSAGPDLLRRRGVFFEYWALAAYAAVLTADPAIRRWFAPRLRAQLALDGRTLYRPSQPPEQLSVAAAAVLAGCDGRRTAIEVAEHLLSDREPVAGLRKEGDVLAQLEHLAAREVVRWEPDLPIGFRSEQVLAQRIAAIGEPDTRERAQAGFARLTAARDAVAAAAGRPDVLRAALDRLDEEFVAVTGAAASRRQGETYAGRSVCVEETERDLDVVIGAPVLAGLARPLAALLQAARWLSAAVADAYTTAFRELYEDLAGGSRHAAGVPLGEFWYLAHGMVFGIGELPVDPVADEFARRWAVLFGLDSLPAGTRRVRRDGGELAEAAAAAFPAERPGWRLARLHSPDLHLCASSPDALDDDDMFAVLGEMHAAVPSLDSAIMMLWHPEPDRLRAAMRADVGPGQLPPLYPSDWPRWGHRTASALQHPDDYQLGIVPAEGPDPARLLPISAFTVTDRSGDLWAELPDGRRWPLMEVFADIVSVHTGDAFKLFSAAPHTPRVTVDRLVVARETWRTTAGATGLAEASGERARYLAARQWRAALDLPDRIFVKLGTETKPVYVDLTSPQHVFSLSGMVCAAVRTAGPDVDVVVSELLPDPSHAWVPDGQGRRYASELRMQLRDPVPSGTDPVLGGRR